MSTQQKIVPKNTGYPSESDQTGWIRLTKHGDRRAFSNIVTVYQKPIYNFCYRMLQNKEETEDAAQEVFLRAYTRLNSYDDRYKFSTWLFSIASHYCIDRLRSRRVQLVSWEDVAPYHSCPDQNAPQPERALLQAEAAGEVRLLLEALSPGYRTVIILKYWHTLSYQEIAQTLETTVSAVKSKLFRARKVMATELATVQAATPRRDSTGASSRRGINSVLKMAQPKVMP